MKKILSHQATIPILLTVFIFLLSAYPWINRMMQQTPDRRFIPFHNSIGDYPTYVSAVKQGIDGNILTYNMYAIAPHKAGLYFVFYAVLGNIGRTIGILDAHFIYHLSRYVLGLLWCFVVYLLIRKFLAGRFERTLAYIFALTSASFPVWVVNNGETKLSWYMNWWTEFDPIKRFAFLPHHLAGHIFLGLALLFFLRAVEEKRARFLGISIVSGWCAGLIHPPSLIILLLILPLWVIWKRKGVREISLFILVTITSLLLMSWQAKQFPWNSSWSYEGLSFAVPLGEVALGLGPIIVLAAAALFFVPKNTYAVLSVLWIAVSLGMIVISKWLLSLPYPIAHIVPLSNVRFLQTAMWVPLAVLGASCCGWIRKKWGMVPIVVILPIYLGVTFLGYPQSIEGQIGELSYNDDYHAPVNEWFSVLHAADSLKNPGPILMLQWAGALLPTYTSRRAYTGGPIITPDHDVMMGNAYKFLKGLPVCDAYKIVHDAGVAGVFSGYDEPLAGNAAAGYPFLRPVKTNGINVLYEVEQWDGCRAQ